MTRGSRAIMALAVILALCVSMGAVAAKKHSIARPALSGAGSQGAATASSTSNEAWIYTGDFRGTTPQRVTGSVRLTASKGARITQDRASATISFNWQGTPYSVRVSCLFPISGEDFPGHGPVQFLRPVLGTNDLGTLNLPGTQAQVAIYGRASILKGNQPVAQSQPVVVLATQAIHASDQALLASPDTSRYEIGVIVPGPLNGQKFVKGFPNGYFYIYWPNVSVNLGGNVQPTPTPAEIPTRTGRGPATPMLGTENPRGTIKVTLSGTGITKQISETPTGLYDIQITNRCCHPRGLVISGIDLCCTSYTRFSELLPPGGTQTMRWYFAPGKARFRDFTGGVRAGTSWNRVKFGGHSTSVTFSSL